MLTSQNVIELKLPHEPTTTVKIRQLASSHLRTARDRRREVSRAAIKDIDIDKVLAARQRIAEQERRDAEERRKNGDAPPAEEPERPYDPYGEFDVATVLHNGIVAWSYRADVTNSNIDDLDEETEDYLFRQIVAHSQRTRDEGKASANGSAASTEAPAVGPTN